MKSQTKLALSFSTFLALGAGGIVHMTSLPEPGSPGFQKPEQLDFEDRQRAKRLENCVAFQADEIGRRSSRYCVHEARFLEYLEMQIVGSRFDLVVQEYEADRRTRKNVIGIKRGTGDGTLVLGTHYDSYGKSPCANASATGVATLVETMRELRDIPTRKDVIVCFFGTGEDPHRGEKTMGAQVWVDRALKEGIAIDQALIVGSFGHYNPAEGAQNSSFPWYLMYPDTADWVAMYAPFTAKGDARTALERWGQVSNTPARGMATPSWMMGVPSADQVPFQSAGIPTVMFSDTGPERDVHFRTKADGPYIIDYEEMSLRVKAFADLVKLYANDDSRG